MSHRHVLGECKQQLVLLAVIINQGCAWKQMLKVFDQMFALLLAYSGTIPHGEGDHILAHQLAESLLAVRQTWLTIQPWSECPSSSSARLLKTTPVLQPMSGNASASGVVSGNSL